MKRKELFLIMFCILPLLSFAGEKKIEVDVAEWRDAHKGRSIPSVPVLTHDGNILFIYSDVPLDNLQILLADEFGNVAYEKTVSIAAGQSYSFIVENVCDYLIELKQGKKYLWGLLRLTQ